jgi:hypothetical protein
MLETPHALGAVRRHTRASGRGQPFTAGRVGSCGAPTRQLAHLRSSWRDPHPGRSAAPVPCVGHAEPVTEPAHPSHALILDVDGVVSPVHSAGSPWGALVNAGNVFGPVLDALARRPGVSCWWLTSWTDQMRLAMDPFPGRAWPVVGSLDDQRGVGRSWWKMAAVQAWVARHPTVRSVAWCDDHLRGGRPAAARRWFRVPRRRGAAGGADHPRRAHPGAPRPARGVGELGNAASSVSVVEAGELLVRDASWSRRDTCLVPCCWHPAWHE